MKKNTQHKKTSTESREEKRPETFNNHWETGSFLGPNTLRYEENKKEYEKKENDS